MEEWYWIYICWSALFFIASCFKINIKFSKIIFRILAFYFSIFPMFHYLNYEIRDWMKVGIAGGLALIYLLILILRRNGDIRDMISSFVESVMGIAEGTLGWTIFIGAILLFWVIGGLIRGIFQPSEAVPADINRYFINCSDAFAQGYSNISRNEPGYRYELDRDNDGIACER